MPHVIFILAGLVSAIHVYSYGRWLKQQGNTPGALVAYLFAAVAVALPIHHVLRI
jgi:hypothetical protein